jgi:isopentenyl-diphosphate Delta-isomerase
MEQVILVDEQDNEVGTMEKMEAHQKGKLHRAFSILVFNSKGEVLLQKRSKKKYHSGGLWTNTCCSHPLPEESMVEATRRKLFQEMGIRPPLKFIFKFIYETRLDLDLIEHEFDHVYVGSFDGDPVINKDEVEDWKYLDWSALQKDVLQNPNDYTYWFRMIVVRPEMEFNNQSKGLTSQ